jgi:hypothetical protein
LYIGEREGGEVMLDGLVKAVLYSAFTLVFSVAIFVFFTNGGATSIYGTVIVVIVFASVMFAVFLRDVGKGLKGNGWDGGYGTPGDSGGD